MTSAPAITHHPEQDLLVAYAAGTLNDALNLILASHLHFCGRCRADVAFAEQVGGAPLAADAFARTMARLDQTDALRGAPGPAPASNDNMPNPLRQYLGRDLSALRWRKMGPRLGYVPLYRDGNMNVRLLRGAPGADTGRHTHGGMEYTLVLAGGFTDETGRYGPGDFQAASGDLKHNPVADDDGEDCINLAVTTASLEFDSLFQKIAAKFFGF
jgi:putative transcriptional regulator